jgi:hypothetical protein
MTHGDYKALYDALKSADPALARRHLAATGHCVDAAGAQLGMRTSDSKIGPTLLDEYLFGDPVKALNLATTLSGMLHPNQSRQSR